MSLLEVNNLMVSYPDFHLHALSFSLDKGEILAVIGESGSGKTTLLKAVSCLLDEDAVAEGEVCFAGRELLSMPEKERKQLRQRGFSIGFQNSTQWLNPSLSLRAQLLEILDRSEERIPDKEACMAQLMQIVGLEVSDLSRRPSELSGGMAQKFLLASAIALKPELVLLDEPTSALDPHARDDFCRLIRRLNQENGTAFLLITHDVKLASLLADKVMVLYNGHMEEMGPADTVLRDPMHPYTRGLINAGVALNPFRDVWGIRQAEEDIVTSGHSHPHCCPFSNRCTQTIDRCHTESPTIRTAADGRQLACLRGGIITALECRGVSKRYGRQQVLQDVSVKLRSGELVSVVGRSGAGKTTLAAICGGYLVKPDSGECFFMGQPADFAKLHRIRGGIQMIFQDSEAALDPHMRVLDAVCEPGRLNGQPDCAEQAVRALRDAGLPVDSVFLNKKVKTLSGGQKQRVSIARALTMEPTVLVADEPTAMLDPSGTANLLRLLKGLQNSRGLSMLLVTHDIESAVKISDRCYLIRDGQAQPVQLTDYFSSSVGELMT